MVWWRSQYPLRCQQIRLGSCGASWHYAGGLEYPRTAATVRRPRAVWLGRKHRRVGNNTDRLFDFLGRDLGAVGRSAHQLQLATVPIVAVGEAGVCCGQSTVKAQNGPVMSRGTDNHQ